MRHLTCIALALVSFTSLARAQGLPPGLDWTPIDRLPFRIERSGGYFLTESAAWDLASSPIFVDADQVSVNLGGYALIGSPGTLSALAVAAGRRDVSVANGSISDFGGVAIEASLVEGGVLQGLVLARNGGGIRCGARYVIRDCVFRDGTGHGLEAGSESVVRDCVASGNGGVGFRVGPTSVVTTCTAALNRTGFEALSGRASFRGCSAAANTNGGFELGHRSHITGCLADTNSGFGILAAFGSTVHDNSVLQNSIVTTSGNCSLQGNHIVTGGIAVTGTSCTIVRNSVANGTYTVPAGNLFGPLVSASQVPTSSNPHANYQL